MTRVGIDARTASNVLGGIRTYSRGLIDGLERLDASHEFVVLRTHSPTKLSTRFRQVDLRTPTRHRFERFGLSVELLRYRLDILHSIDFIPPLRGARYHVITVHDLAFLRYPKILTPSARRYYNDQIEYAVGHADHILAVSEATKGDLVELLGVPPDRVTVQSEGVDDVFHPMEHDDDRREARTRLRLPDDYFLFVGTLEPRKNIPRLLDAYAVARAQLENAPDLVIVGRRGWLFDERLIASDRDGVSWYGEAAYEDLPALYGLATALVMPSHYEGFGLPALEAMACGTVPVVSDNSSPPEVVGDVGLLVQPRDTESIADALCRVATHDSWRRQQEHEALARARQFTWERCARTALRVYDDLVG